MQTYETYEEYKRIADRQNAIVDDLSNRLNAFPKGEMGLTPDHVRKSEDYQVIKRGFDRAFKTLQSVNKEGMRLFKKEIRETSQQKRKQQMDNNRSKNPQTA